MIRAVVQNGVIQPLDPLPPDWQDGRHVEVRDLAEPSANGGPQEDFITRARRLDRAGHTNAALDLVYDTIDDLMHSAAFGELNTLLARIAPADLSTDLLLGSLRRRYPHGTHCRHEASSSRRLSRCFAIVVSTRTVS